MSKTPKCVQARHHVRICLHCRLGQSHHLLPRDQLVLCAKTQPLIRKGQQLEESLRILTRHRLADECRKLFHSRIRLGLRVSHLQHLLPASELIEDRGEHPTIPSEIEIRRQDRPCELMPLFHLHSRTFGGQPERPNSSAARGVGVVTEKKEIRITFRKAQSGIVNETRRPVRYMRHGRQHPCGLRLVLQLPKTFGDPRPPHVVAGQRLESHGPSRLTALDQIDNSRGVTAIAIIITGKQVPVVIEGQLLRIPHTRREDLQVAAVGIHPKHRTTTRSHRRLENLALVTRHAVPAVPHREIDLSVRAPDETVQVMPDEGGLHAEACVDRFDRFSDAVIIEVFYAIDRRDRCDENRAFPRFDTRNEP